MIAVPAAGAAAASASAAAAGATAAAGSAAAVGTAAAAGAGAATAAGVTSGVTAATLGSQAVLTGAIGASGIAGGSAISTVGLTAAEAAAAAGAGAAGGSTLSTGALMTGLSAAVGLGGHLWSGKEQQAAAKTAAKEEAIAFQGREAVRQRGLRVVMNNAVADAAARGIVPGTGSSEALLSDSALQAQIEGGVDAGRSQLERYGLLLRARRAPVFGAVQGAAGVLGNYALYQAARG